MLTMNSIVVIYLIVALLIALGVSYWLGGDPRTDWDEIGVSVLLSFLWPIGLGVAIIYALGFITISPFILVSKLPRRKGK